MGMPSAFLWNWRQLLTCSSESRHANGQFIKQYLDTEYNEQLSHPQSMGFDGIAWGLNESSMKHRVDNVIYLIILSNVTYF